MNRQLPEKVLGDLPASTDLPEGRAGRRYRFDVLPVEEGLDVLGKALKNFGPVISLVGKDGFDAAAVAALCKSFNIVEVRELVAKLITCVACLDQKGSGICTINGTFQGRYMELFQVAVESFKVNFSDFLAVLSSTSNQEDPAK